MPWLVTRYTKEMSVGDGVLIWVVGKDAAIYAITVRLVDVFGNDTSATVKVK